MKEITVINQQISLNPISVYADQVTRGAEALKQCLEVDTAAKLEGAVDMLQRSKKLSALVNKEVESLCRPLKDQKKDIDQAQRQIKGYAEKMLLPLTEVTISLEQNIISFQKKEAERAEAERKEAEAREAAERSAMATDDPQGEYDLEDPVNAQKPVVEAPKVKGMTSSWKFEIDDPYKVPREFCSPDEKIIRQAIANGAREIPGVRIFEDTKIRRS